MTSCAALALSVALPLGLCLLILVTICAILLLWFRHYRTQDQALQATADRCGKLEKELINFRKARGVPLLEFQDSAVRNLYCTFHAMLVSYVEKWIASDGAPSLSGNESAARVEAILFPEPLSHHPWAEGKDTSLFQNPHLYTPAEIVAFLEHKYTRKSISHHIITYVLLNGISIEGNPIRSLLPFSPGDVLSLDKLYTLIRRVELSSDVLTHIGEFGIYSTTKPKSEVPDYKPPEREPYITLFESLFGPYFKTKSPAEVTQRQHEFDSILDAAVELGIKVISYPHQRIDYRWGERDRKNIMTSPPVYALRYGGEGLKTSSELVGGDLGMALPD